jgi:hypothetical protein
MKHIRRCQLLKLEALGEVPTFGVMPVGYYALRPLRPLIKVIADFDLSLEQT